MQLAAVTETVALAGIEGMLVALPKPDAFASLARLRSAAWAALLPCSVVVGTLVVLVFRPSANVLVAAAAVLTPLMVALGVSSAARVPWATGALAALAAALMIAFGTGWLGQSAETVLTAFGCLSVGAVLARIIPSRALAVGILAMCSADVALIALGFGEPAWVAMRDAAAHFRGPVLVEARIGEVSTDWIDFVLAALVGGMLAGNPRLQRRAAALLTVTAVAYGLLALLAAHVLPATVPLAATLAVLGRKQLRTTDRAVAPAS
jgi:hypothetical protein